MSNKDYLISLLKIEDAEIVSWSLQEIFTSIECHWFWFISKATDILEVQSRFPKFKTQINLLLSKIFFYANDMPKAVEHALSAEELFDLSDRSLYTDHILTLIMTNYIQAKNGKLDLDESVLAKYQQIVEKVLGTSLAQKGKGESGMLLGLAIETQNFDFFKALIKEISDEELSSMFLFMSRRVYEPHLKNKILTLYREEFQKREGKFVYNISKSYFLLNMPNDHADYLVSLILGKIFIFIFFEKLKFIVRKTFKCPR